MATTISLYKQAMANRMAKMISGGKLTETGMDLLRKKEPFAESLAAINRAGHTNARVVARVREHPGTKRVDIVRGEKEEGMFRGETSFKETKQQTYLPEFRKGEELRKAYQSVPPTARHKDLLSTRITVPHSEANSVGNFIQHFPDAPAKATRGVTAYHEIAGELAETMGTRDAAAARGFQPIQGHVSFQSNGHHSLDVPIVEEKLVSQLHPKVKAINDALRTEFDTSVPSGSDADLLSRYWPSKKHTMKDRLDAVSKVYDRNRAALKESHPYTFLDLDGNKKEQFIWSALHKADAYRAGSKKKK